MVYQKQLSNMENQRLYRELIFWEAAWCDQQMVVATKIGDAPYDIIDIMTGEFLERGVHSQRTIEGLATYKGWKVIYHDAG